MKIFCTHLQPFLRTGFILGILLFAPAAVAQNIFEPPASPPGGNSASWISTDATTERKLGSVMIGSFGSPASLCLNASGVGDTDRCVTSWNDAIAKAGDFVLRRTSGLSASDQANPLKYFDIPTATKVGTVVIQAGSNQAISLLAEANTGINSASYGLYAGNSGALANYAAYFDGLVGVGPTKITGVGVPPPGEICLNGTSPYVYPNPYGCVSSWSQVVGSAGNYVRLQANNPPTADVGNAAVNEIANFGSVMVGHPPANQPAKSFCGDAICSTHLNEQLSTDANYCIIDCTPVVGPFSLIELFSYQGIAQFRMRAAASNPTTITRLLLIRSENPAFITNIQSEFVPQNGVIYNEGSTIGSLRVVYSRQVSTSTDVSISDTGLVDGTTYYYRLYQSNNYPIYYPNPLVESATPTPECPDPLPFPYSCA